VGTEPATLKVFVKPADVLSLDKPPGVCFGLPKRSNSKQQTAESQAALKKVQVAAAAEVKTKSDQVRADYPDTDEVLSITSRKTKPPFKR